MHLYQILLCIAIHILTVSSFVIDMPSNTLLVPYENTYNNIHTTTSNRTHSPHLTDMRIECKATTPPLTTPLDFPSCIHAARIACRRLSSNPLARLPKDQWIWIELSPFQHCAIAYWIPSDTLPERVPGERECVVQIYEPMIERCAGRARENIATVNVGTLPDAWGPGTERDVGWPSYIVASEALGALSR